MPSGFCVKPAPASLMRSLWLAGKVEKIREVVCSVGAQDTWSMAGEKGGRTVRGRPGESRIRGTRGIEKLQRENAKLIDDLDRTTRDLDRTTRDLDRTTRDLDRTTRDLDRTTRDRDRWKRRSEDLKKQLDEARRAGKRQAAPFAKDRPQGTGKRPGRRPGALRPARFPRCPPKVDETHRASADGVSRRSFRRPKTRVASHAITPRAHRAPLRHRGAASACRGGTASRHPTRSGAAAGSSVPASPRSSSS